MSVHRRIPAGTRRLQRELRALRIIDPPTEEQKTLIQAAINVRTVKGFFRDAYTKEELELLEHARAVAADHGQRKAMNFLFTRRRIYEKIPQLEVPESNVMHACPQCGTFHLDKGVKEPNLEQVKKDEKKMLLRLIERRRKVRLQQQMERAVRQERRREDRERRMRVRP